MAAEAEPFRSGLLSLLLKSPRRTARRLRVSSTPADQVELEDARREYRHRRRVWLVVSLTGLVLLFLLLNVL